MPISIKTCQKIVNCHPGIRALVFNWFDGDPTLLKKREYGQFLRRLTVRALRELGMREISSVTLEGSRYSTRASLL